MAEPSSSPMGSGPENKIPDLVEIVRSWIPRRSEPANVSRDFWMPDQSCRVCYECDSQFTVFNRRHHCRLCGRVFCAKCTASSIPASPAEGGGGGEDSERIRVCSFCFSQWDRGIEPVVAPAPGLNGGLSPSQSGTSLVSSKSSCTGQSSASTAGSAPYSTGPYQHVPSDPGLSPCQSVQLNPVVVREERGLVSQRSLNLDTATGRSLPDQYDYFTNRSDDDEDDDYGRYPNGTDTRDFSRNDAYFGEVAIEDIDQVYGPHNIVQSDEDNTDVKTLEASLSVEDYDAPGVIDTTRNGEEGDKQDARDEHEENMNSEAVDFENNGLLWIPPPPEDEEDDREAALCDDDDEDCGSTGEWGYLRSTNSFGSGEYRTTKEKSNEGHRNAMKNVVEGHFKALVAQLLQAENLPVGDDENDKEGWMEIVTSLSWEAATLLKPDMSKSGGMDPGGYVKVKCIACGRRSESMVVKGVVCKKNMAHRRMTSKIEKPRFLILGGALEYQRVSNLLSSFDTLLQQEMDHLKMAVAKIDAHHPDVLLVEKSVSRHAQEYLLAKNISLVLNIKRPLLERIARCTGAQIVSSIDHLTSPKLGYCDLIHVDKFLENHGSAGQGGKKLIKTLMFFEGCPKPLGCTVLLKGASAEELKKVKHVVQYGVFAAYHLALETSFLADEGASIPELPLKAPITVALPDKPSSIDRSISTIPGFNSLPSANSKHNEVYGTEKSINTTNLERDLSTNCKPFPKLEVDIPRHFPNSSILADSVTPMWAVGHDNFNGSHNQMFHVEGMHGNGPEILSKENVSDTRELVLDPNSVSSDPNSVPVPQITLNRSEHMEPLKEDFPPSPSDNQSILVSLSTRCVWKGTVCERAHLFRIKYYGNFDKPLGRFLRDHLFDQNYLCRSCGMQSEAHVHCYTHRQGSLTICVKKLESVLPGEKEGKIWMWHRCLKCRRTSGFPPATPRIIMSDAAWGLSFGKFLELSFSNHAAASRVASCGHSLHRDCLRFYGFGRMVACFRYASIDVLSVHPPPLKLEFYYADQEWIHKEADEVREQAELLFTEVKNALRQILQKTEIVESHTGFELRQQVKDLEEMLQQERKEVEESLQKAVSNELKVGQPVIDILEINKLRRLILFHSYFWEQRLIQTISLNKKNNESLNNSTPKLKEKFVASTDKIIETSVTVKLDKSFSSCNSFVIDTKPGIDQKEEAGKTFQPDGLQNSNETDPGENIKDENNAFLSSEEDVDKKNDPLADEESLRNAHSDGEYPTAADLSDTLDAAWTGECPATTAPIEDGYMSADSNVVKTVTATANFENPTGNQGKIEVIRSVASAIPQNGRENSESTTRLLSLPFSRANNLTKSLPFGSQKLVIGENVPIYMPLFRGLERQSGARLLLPVGVNDTVVPIFDDEPTSIIAYALVSPDYHLQISESEKPKDAGDSSIALPIFDSLNLLSLNSFDESMADTYRSFASGDETMLSTSTSRGSQVVDPAQFSKDLHARVSFSDDGPLGKVKYTVTCYYAKGFEALRRMCCPSELDFVRSLSRGKKWGAQGGKSNVFFAKTLDDRFIIKQVTKTELESFIMFGPAYFKYLTESISTRSPTCLAKILGIYQVSSKHAKGGKEFKMDVLVMENLLFRRRVTRVYDLKGSTRSRYNADTSGTNTVLLDQNLIEAMSTSPIFVGNKAKRVLERAVWNDTSFLASIDVMDYSLLVGVDEKKHELVLGIIDFVRQYTWDKHLETWVKTSGFLGGPNNAAPTVISPDQYKKRFRKAMSMYFLMVPDQWLPPTIIPSRSQSELCEENNQGGTFD